MKARKQSSVVKIENSAEYKQLVEQSIREVEEMTNLAIKSGMDAEKAREKIASIYLRNLQQTDDIVSLAKKNVAELMTRIQLDRAINVDEELVSDKYIKLFKLQNETLQLISRMEPRKLEHAVQLDDDKMIFEIKEGVYTENDEPARSS